MINTRTIQNKILNSPIIKITHEGPCECDILVSRVFVEQIINKNPAMLMWFYVYYSTGCPKVHVNFDTPLFSGMGQRTRLIFHMLNKWCGRFCLMHKTLKYNPPTYRRFSRKVGQITDKLGKKTHLQRGRMRTCHRKKRVVLTFLNIFCLFCLHIEPKCHEGATLNAVKKWKNKATLWLYSFLHSSILSFSIRSNLHPTFP